MSRTASHRRAKRTAYNEQTDVITNNMLLRNDDMAELLSVGVGVLKLVFRLDVRADAATATTKVWFYNDKTVFGEECTRFANITTGDRVWY